MFLKRINAKSKEGKKQTYWALVKSVRTARGPRHQVVSYLGELQAGERSEWANLARIVNKRPIPRRRSLTRSRRLSRSLRRSKSAFAALVSNERATLATCTWL